MRNRLRQWARLAGMIALCAAVPLAARAQLCAGDCDGNRTVTVDELIRGVGFALGTGGECASLDRDRDGAAQINELVAAVGRALGGCDNGLSPAAAVVRHYADMLYANYGDAERLARALRTSIQAFVASPSAVTLAAAKEAWFAARPTYLQTEAARFYGGPIDNDDDGPEGFINAWPLDEAYIDYVEGNAQAGIINDLVNFPEITTATLVDANEAGGETNIATGWHAIEFLLWGQDQSADGPGNRPFTDYVTGAGGTAANQTRRGTYLLLAADLLIEHLNQVKDAWAPGHPDNYRTELLSVATDEALRRILTGMGTLSGGELTGERLATAFETKDQEDEHSCFSDNTHVDHRNDALGIQNFWLGRYSDLEGPGIVDLVAAVNADLAAATSAQIQAAVNALFAIPTPFDQAILGPDSTPGRMAIAAAIDELNAQTDLIATCAEALGISISTTG